MSKTTNLSRSLLLLAVALATFACGPNERIRRSSNERGTPAAAETVSSQTQPPSFEQDLESMRTADFRFIYVIRRKDGSPLDAEDRDFIIRTSPPGMNRRKVSDEGKAVIIGSNFPMPPATIDVLRERLLVDDHSPGVQ